MWFIKDVLIMLASILIVLTIPTMLIFLLAFAIVYKLFKLVNYSVDKNIYSLAIMIFSISTIVFGMTFLAYIIFKKIGKDKKFLNLFEWNYLVNSYIWGFVTLLNIMKPSLINNNILKAQDFIPQESIPLI